MNYLTNRSVGLDILRASAILLVMIDHSKFFLIPHWEHYPSLALFSFYGVELFFVLSGFLIGTKLFNLFINEFPPSTIILFNFWKRRWLRTLPNYFLILLLLIFITPNIAHIPLWKYFLFVQNLIDRIPSFYMVSWSLSVEEWFYLAMPIVFFIVGVFRRSSLLSIILTCVILIVLFAAFRTLNTQQYSDWNLDLRQVVVYRADSILYGVVMAGLNIKCYNWIFRNKRYLMLCGMVVVFISIYLFDNIEVKNNLLFILTGTGFSMIMPYFKSAKFNLKPFVAKPIIQLSLISYSLYLINYDIVLTQISNYYNPYTTDLSPLSSLGYFLIFWTASIFLASILFKYFELPIIRYRDRVIPVKKNV